MSRRTNILAIFGLLFLTVSTCWPATAQDTQAISGIYALVSSKAFGEKPLGVLNLGRDGHYSLILVKRDLPNIASGVRTTATADENKAIIDGSSAHFGTYTVDMEKKIIFFNCEGSTFPNYTGTVLKRPFSISGKQLVYSNVAPTDGGGAADVVLSNT